MRGNQPSPFTVRVLVVDNSPIHSELLANAIQRERSIKILASISSSTDILKAAAQFNPEILLISATLEERPGYGCDRLKELRKYRPHLKSVVLLDSSSPEMVIRAFKSGARGVFCRNEPLKSLCRCISVIHEGQVWASTQELGYLLDALSSGNSVLEPGVSALTGLSERERDVVRRLAEGLTNKEIADRLGISQHTVKNYMFRIFEKLGVSSRVELLFFVLSQPGGQQATSGGVEEAAEKPIDPKAPICIQPRQSSQKDLSPNATSSKLEAGKMADAVRLCSQPELWNEVAARLRLDSETEEAPRDLKRQNTRH